MLWTAAVWSSYIFLWFLGIYIIMCIVAMIVLWIIDTWINDREKCIGIVCGTIILVLFFVSLIIISINKDYEESNFINVEILNKE